MRHIFIIGSKGIPAAYGGYETFLDKLTEYHQNKTEFKYHIACKGDAADEFEYHNARCFRIKVPDIGPAQAIYYDIAALQHCCAYIRKNSIKDPIIYILACRIGPAAAHFQRNIHKLGGRVFVNPDGHEWMRAKWSASVRKYWKISERMMVKHADLLICDSKNIESYIHEEYMQYHPKTTFIAYGAETKKAASTDVEAALLDWYKEKNMAPKSYYLVVSRLVPENNYETMIREFMHSRTKRTFALITNSNEDFYKKLIAKTGFDQDPRIQFMGTVYDRELLMKIRENAYGYLHGHEVGGTNPSLLEAMASTELNMLLNVGFNREVGEDGALYWTREHGNLAALIDKTDQMQEDEIRQLGVKAKQRIASAYSWEHIADLYEALFAADARENLLDKER